MLEKAGQSVEDGPLVGRTDAASTLCSYTFKDIHGLS